MKNLFLRHPARVLAGFAVLMVLVMPLMAPVVYGQGTFGATPPTSPRTGINNVDDVFTFIAKTFNLLFWLLLVLASIFIILAAFAYLTAGGDPEKVKKANHRLIYAAVAVVVAVLAKAIPSVVCNFLAESCGDIDA